MVLVLVVCIAANLAYFVELHGDRKPKRKSTTSYHVFGDNYVHGMVLRCSVSSFGLRLWWWMSVCVGVRAEGGGLPCRHRL